MNESLALLPLIMQASLVVKAVMALLVLLSVISWLLIFRLSAKVSGALRDDTQFELWFWEKSTPQIAHHALTSDLEHQGLAQVFFVGYDEYLTLNTRLKKRPSTTKTHEDALIQATERKFAAALGRQQAYIEHGLPTLASIASVSPYIGLFGTVWGIMTAFIGLGDAQSVSLATVAPGIAEALIATAMGLFCAIPASLAFNHFTAKSATLYESRTLFCNEVTGTILANQLVNS